MNDRRCSPHSYLIREGASLTEVACIDCGRWFLENASAPDGQHEYRYAVISAGTNADTSPDLGGTVDPQ